MRGYEVRAVDPNGVIHVATTNTASQAMIKLIDLRAQYRRAWVMDGSGSDVSLEQLSALSSDEQGER